MNDFELYDFIADANFGQFINQIRGENEDQIANFGCADDLINGCFVHNDNNINSMVLGPNNNNNNVSTSVFGFEDTTANNAIASSNPDSLLGSGILLPDLDGEIMMVGDDDEENDGEDSSGTTTATRTNKRGKVDRSRTLISERRRRGRMKEKLYALRSLVPNITKMDKASIVGDAVLYVQDLQARAKKLKAEIESLEASLEEAERYQSLDNHHHNHQTNNNTTSKPISNSSIVVPNNIIIQMDMFQVEERGFYVKVVCYNGEGTAVSLYKALESLTNFNVHTSNLATVSDTFVLTFTLNVKECDHQEQINLPNLKLWVTGAFLNQGFQLS